MTGCPSELKLEAYLLAPHASAARGHVDSCPACQARLAAMRSLGEEFEREVLPATERLVAEAPFRRAEAPGPAAVVRRFPRWAQVAAPVAAAAVVLFAVLVRDRSRPELDLTVLLDHSGRVEPVQDGAVVPAGAALRFRVQPATPCNLWVLSVHPDGDIVRIYPPKGDRAAEQRLQPVARQDLPTTAVLDGTGPERIFAVCTRTPVPWNTVKTAAAEKLGKGEAGVRSYRAIPGLPKGATQSTLLVEKRS